MATASADTLTVNEIYPSIQGESSWAGWRCVFVRLTFCNLRCSYCDTEYAFYKGDKRSVDSVVEEVLGHGCPMVEVTGGEPLLQPAALPLMERLCDAGLRVLLETGGSLDIAPVDPRVHRIVDLKAPSSGECERNRIENIPLLTDRDELKFVLGNRADYEWMRALIAEHDLSARCTVLVSPVFGKVEPAALVDWILEDRLEVRFQLQIHKFIWDPAAKGV